MPLEGLVLLAGAALIALASMARRISGSWLFPPALFAGAWAGFLLGSLVVRFGQLDLTPPAILVFVTGAVVFVLAGTLTWAVVGTTGPPVALSPRRGRLIRRLILCYSLTLAALIPIFLNTIGEALQQLNLVELATGARTIFSGEGIELVPRYFLSVSSIGTILTLFMAWLYDGTRRDRLLLLFSMLSTLGMLALTFARSPLFTLMVGVGGILLFRGRISKATAMAGLVVTAAAGLLVGSLLGKGPDFAGNASAAQAVVQNLGEYFIGGPVGFAQVMDRPTAVGEFGLSLRFFTQLVQSLGMEITLPNNVLGYSVGGLGNVYTWYFAYWLDWGWWGIIVVAFAAGSLVTLLYCGARRGNPISGVGLGIALPALINSATGDGLFGSSVPWILTILLVGLLWKAPWPRSTS